MMENATLANNCVCHFCQKSVMWDSLLPAEMSDRLNDLNALRLLTSELKEETQELVEGNCDLVAAQKRAKTKIEGVQSDRMNRLNEENSAKYIDSCCLQLAEESVELRKENETLALLKHRRRQQQENLDLKKLIHASLIQNMNDSPQYVRALRFREVCSVFKMMSIIPDIPPRAASKAKNEKTEILRGVSTIMGLPLLNSGNYEGIPVEVVSSALSLAAHLVDTVASILNIHLDHPLRPFETFECVISPNFDHSLLLPLTPAVGVNFSTTQHLFAPFAAKWRNKSLDEKESVLNAPNAPVSQKKKEKNDSSNRSSRFDKTSAANKSGEGTQGDWILNPSFSVALSLFRANVITLCLRSGIEGSVLWPHEAILLNLDVLQKKCVLESELNDPSSAQYQLKFNSYVQFPTSDIDFNDNDDHDDEYLPGLVRRYRSQRITKMSNPSVY